MQIRIKHFKFRNSWSLFGRRWNRSLIKTNIYLPGLKWLINLPIFDKKLSFNTKSDLNYQNYRKLDIFHN